MSFKVKRWTPSTQKFAKKLKFAGFLGSWHFSRAQNGRFVFFHVDLAGREWNSSMWIGNIRAWISVCSIHWLKPWSMGSLLSAEKLWQAKLNLILDVFFSCNPSVISHQFIPELPAYIPQATHADQLITNKLDQAPIVNYHMWHQTFVANYLHPSDRHEILHSLCGFPPFWQPTNL